jgi:hypothetical protein
MKSSIVLLALIGVTACASPPPATPPRAESSDGQFRLVFELPRTDWHVADSITGLATLSYSGSGDSAIYASGMGPIAFKFQEVGGSRHMDGLQTSDLLSYPISATRPITSPIKKSVSYGADDPNASFYEAFYRDPLVHLPPGDWTITTLANFTDSDSSLYSLETTVRVHVSP